MIYSENNEGYSEFLKTLQAEASGDHSHLWKSFYAVFKGSDAVPNPLRENDTVQSKFDGKTKGMVANMSSHLKRTSNAQCFQSTQLVNDSKASKPSFGQHLLQPNKQNIDVLETSRLQPFTMIVQDDDSDKEYDEGGAVRWKR